MVKTKDLSEKALMRNRLKKIRNALSESERRRKSALIAEKLFSTPEYKSAKTVMIYMSFGSEVMTDEIFSRVLLDGKRLCVPLCNVADKSMTAYVVKDKSDFSKGSYGILEPKRINEVCLKQDIDLIIVPGLGFDKSGYRIGYGAGYYDRYLDRYFGYAIGLCYSECFMDSVVYDEYDKTVDRVLFD